MRRRIPLRKVSSQAAPVAAFWAPHQQQLPSNKARWRNSPGGGGQMCPTQCKHSSILVERGRRRIWRRTKYAKTFRRLHILSPAAALGLAAALAIRPRNPQEQGIPAFSSDQTVLHIYWKSSPHVNKKGILGIQDSRHSGVLAGTFLKINGIYID